MMTTTIVIDEKNRDTAATHIAAFLANQGGTETINLSDFLLRAGVSFNTQTGNLVWDKTTFQERFPDLRCHRICNRVVSISLGTAAALDGHQEVLRPNLVFHTYASVLQEFPNVWGKPGMYSPVGHFLPLNLQWHLFKSKIWEINTPRFAYGFGFANIDIHDFRRPLWKAPFDLYGWKPQEIDKNRIHPFVVDKPEGKPVSLCFVGDAAEVFSLGTDQEVDERIKLRLISIVSSIKEMFRAFMGEALFFADDDRLTFAAFSHYMKTSLDDSRFPALLQRGLAEVLA